MKLLLIRHAIAEDRNAYTKSGGDDELRPLTKIGIKKFTRAAEGLLRLVPKIDVLASSPLARAHDTAKILSEVCGKLKIVTVAALSPGKKPAELLTWLKSQRKGSVVAVVGHEPDLGIFACWMLTGLQESFVKFKKGGAILIEFEKDVAAGRGTLVWSSTPKVLRSF